MGSRRLLTSRDERGLLVVLFLAYGLVLAGAPPGHGGGGWAHEPAGVQGPVDEASRDGTPSDPHSHDGPFCLICHALGAPASVPAGASLPAARIRQARSARIRAAHSPAVWKRPRRARAPPGDS